LIVQQALEMVKNPSSGLEICSLLERSNKLSIVDDIGDSSVIIFFQMDHQIGIIGEAAFHPIPKFPRRLGIKDNFARVGLNMLKTENRSHGWEQSREGHDQTHQSVTNGLKAGSWRPTLAICRK
jgi:hypothetical protein